MPTTDDHQPAPEDWIGPLDASGGCLCGSVRFRVRGLMRPPLACHCETCQRTSGHFVAATQVQSGSFTLEADDTLVWYRSSANIDRGFCRACGSQLFYRPIDGEHFSIMMGVLDRPRPPELRLAGHIFVAEKPAYYEIGDDCRQFSEWAGSDLADETVG